MANGPVRHTKQKDAVMAQLRGCDDFISAQELHRKLVDSGLRIGLATVYRQLNAGGFRSGGYRAHGWAAAVPPMRR